MLRFVGIFLLGLGLPWQCAYSESLSIKIDTLIEQQLPHATVGIVVKDANTGQLVYSKNPDKLLSPASSMKLFTAAAAFYQLKPDYHFLTALLRKNQDYYISFSGDPSFTEHDLTALLLELKQSNVKKIEGNIVLDVSRFKAPFYPDGTSIDDLGWYYSAPDTAAILDKNTVAYDFISAKKPGFPIQIKPKTASGDITIMNQVKTVTKEQAKEHCNLNIEIKAHNTLRLYGCLAQNSEPRTMRLAIPDPILSIEQVIKKILVKQGVILKGRIILGNVPRDAKPMAQHQSADLTTLITYMLKESDNLYASSVTKALGYALTKEGTNKQGVFAIKTSLLKHTNLDASQIEIADGAGTRYNLVTPGQVVVLLTNLYQNQSLQNIFTNALPQAGVSGSLQERMKHTTLEKKVFAKTGTMHDISSLSGYLLDKPDRPLVFSIMINGVNKPISTAKALEEQILFAISEAPV
ncbi:MAG: D-alanyl-D-alanine carboxypeptidase/D-alanyl-D-alanine-endopeptidase [Gammaproteobacteria bacterium]|nr:D-alanyl-D-alanine carboxypeptidase/D-alanyl-D-alanine-endopeptidase [Gammaproteobacteria bacterium]